jgi:hypothetical protein
VGAENWAILNADGTSEIVRYSRGKGVASDYLSVEKAARTKEISGAVRCLNLAVRPNGTAARWIWPQFSVPADRAAASDLGLLKQKSKGGNDSAQNE